VAVELAATDRDFLIMSFHVLAAEEAVVVLVGRIT